MILLNDFRRRWLDTRQDTLSALEKVGTSGWYILGPEVCQFETALASTWGVRHAVAVSSGLDAIEISLRALGCASGQKVLTTPLSAFATTLAILKLGATPVFVDCDRFGLIDLDACGRALRSDSAIRFFVPVHLYGHSLDLHKLRALMEAYEIQVVEDCAQSISATFDGITAGSVGQFAATSFYPTKNLGALGDGGAVLTNDSVLAEKARILRDYGQSGKYQHTETGYNSRLDELQAAILRGAHLPRLPAWSAGRRNIAEAYEQGIRHPEVVVPGAPGGSASAWHLFPVYVKDGRKLDFINHMRERGVAVAEHYPTAIIDQPALARAPHEIHGHCKEARWICCSEVSLPIHPYLKVDEVEAVIDACNSWSH
jgi:dTDP-3-amino-3,4,6-trideoxy-alpha-D-glucose transaminase